MLKNFKNTITDLAFSAVNYAENKLSTATGKEKKQIAITFLIEKLAIPNVIKPFAALFFSKFIDNAIEQAVKYLNQVKNED